MSAIAFSAAATDTVTDYVALGLATCFIKEDGEVYPVQVIEPIPSSTLETIDSRVVPTSYEFVIAVALSDVLKDGELTKPEAFPEGAQFCDDFADRAAAAVRTYQARPEDQKIVPLGSRRDDFNYSIERKRMLKGDRTVRVEDNVKQHAYTHAVL